MKKTVLSFGVFDGLHPGHFFFLKQAKEQGNELIISLARDEVVLELKGSLPTYHFNLRKKALTETGLVGQVIRGDYTIGAYRSVTVARPQVICLGYDQQMLKLSLDDWMSKYEIIIPIITVDAFQPENYKSSLLNK